jgi:hypothetical protein
MAHGSFSHGAYAVVNRSFLYIPYVQRYVRLMQFGLIIICNKSNLVIDASQYI